jgi:O-antigen ligase
VFAILFPIYGIDEGAMAGDWRGVFIQKNGLAQAMVLACIVFLYVRPKVRPAFFWLCFTGGIALLFLSASATGLVVLAALLLSLPLYKLIGARFTLVIPVILGLALLTLGLCLALKANSTAAFHALDRSPDMTGRTELWAAVWHSISKRPWLGYGFSAFWQGTQGESGTVLDAVGWPAGYSHNGFLEVMVQLGVWGVVTFLVGYFVLWRRVIAFASMRSPSATRWLGTYLAFMLLYNLTECSILEQNTIYWILYIAVAVSLCTTKSPCFRAETAV